MSNVNMEGLPPEMQQRIAIIEKCKATAAVEQQAPAPVAKYVNLADGSHHCSPSRSDALRQELAGMQVAARVNVEAVGQAVGQLYANVLPANRNYRSSPTYSRSSNRGRRRMTTEKPYRIQTPSGYANTSVQGLYMPSVTTVLSATETEKVESKSKDLATKQSRCT